MAGAVEVVGVESTGWAGARWQVPGGACQVVLGGFKSGSRVVAAAWAGSSDAAATERSAATC